MHTCQDLGAELQQHINATWQQLQQGTLAAVPSLTAVIHSQSLHHLSSQVAEQHIKAALSSLLSLLWQQHHTVKQLAWEQQDQEEYFKGAAASLVSELTRHAGPWS